LRSPLSLFKRKNIERARGRVGVLTSSSPYTPTVDFGTLKDIWDKDESAALAIQFTAEAMVGAGHYIETEPYNKDAIAELDRFAEDVGMDEYMFGVAQEIVGFGNSFTELINPGDLQSLLRLPIDVDWKIYRNPVGGEVLSYEYYKGGNVKLPANRVLHYKYLAHSTEAFGRGILHYFAESKTYTLEYSDGSTKDFTVPSLAVMKWMWVDDLRLIFHHYPPKACWYIEGDDDYVASKAKSIGKMSPGERIVVNHPVQIQTETIDPNARLGDMLNYFDMTILRAAQLPHLRLFTERGFSEASSRVVVEQWNRKINMLRRFLARNIERHIYRQVLDQAGFNVSPKIRWYQEAEPTWQLQDLVNLAREGYLSKEDIQQILKRRFKLPLEVS